MNKVIFIGNLTRDPEAGTTQSGVAYCRFTIAVNRRFSRDNENTADFFNITCWRGLAESCSKNLQKGRKVCVVGSLQTNQYTANDGSKRTSYDVIADEVEFLTSAARNDGDNTQGSEHNYGSNHGGRNNGGGLTPVDEDDLPF